MSYWWTQTDARLARIEKKLDSLIATIGVSKTGKTLMATASDLATAVTNLQADDQAIGAGIAAVQAALAGLAAGTVTQAELDAAVAGLAQAHTDFQANVATLGTIAANP